MATSGTAPVNDSGASLHYIDSGPVQEREYPYTTLVCLHGHTYHSQNFRLLLPIAYKYNLRIIAPNRRDYVDSTLYTPQELADLNSGSEPRLTSFQRDRGLEIAKFLIYIIKEKNIPKISEDGRSGGLALMGWSAGNITTIAFLRHVDSYPQDVIDGLKDYLRVFVIYEASYSGMGLPPPEKGYHPLSDPAVPERMRGIAFGTWVSSYYQHPNLASKSISGLILKTPQDPYRPSTNDLISFEDLIQSIDRAPANRSEQMFYNPIVRDVLYDQTRGAIFDEALARKVWPHLKVRLLVCEESIWSAHWGAWELEKEAERVKEQGVNGRDLSIMSVEGANHFLHWDDPEKALLKFCEACHS